MCALFCRGYREIQTPSLQLCSKYNTRLEAFVHPLSQVHTLCSHRSIITKETAVWREWSRQEHWRSSCCQEMPSKVCTKQPECWNKSLFVLSLIRKWGSLIDCTYHTHPGLILLTDGICGFPSPGALHTSVNMMRGHNISCWVVHVGGPPDPTAAFGLLPDIETLGFMTEACNGCLMEPEKVIGRKEATSTCTHIPLMACPLPPFLHLLLFLSDPAGSEGAIRCLPDCECSAASCSLLDLPKRGPLCTCEGSQV